MKGGFLVGTKVLQMRDFIRPARPLGKHGTELWRSVNQEYRIEGLGRIGYASAGV